ELRLAEPPPLLRGREDLEPTTSQAHLAALRVATYGSSSLAARALHDATPSQPTVAATATPAPAPGPHGHDGGGPPHSARSLEVLWREFQHAVRARVEPAQFATWLQRAVLVHVDDHVLRVGVQNDFSREWLERYYAEPLAVAARETLGAPRRIEVVV